MDTLKRQRSNLKGGLTRICHKSDAIYDANTSNVHEIKTVMELIEKKFQDFNVVQDQIEADLSELELNEEAEHRQTVENQYISAISKCKQKLSELTANERELNQSQANTLETLALNQNQLTTIVRSLTDSHRASAPTPTLTETQHSMKMPAITIPQFDGDYKEWPSFHDIFQSVVDNSKILSPVQKFQYLKTSLRGEAASTLKHLTITEANYTAAYELLKRKYNKKGYIVESHLKAIMQSEGIRHPTAEGLRAISNLFNEAVTAMKALKLPVGHWNHWLNFVLVSKLDKESEQLWRRQIATVDEPTFDDLTKFLDDRIYELSVIHNSQPRASKLQLSYNQKGKSTHAVTTITCSMCRRNHYLFACPQFTHLSHSDREAFIKKNGFCFNCLKGKHLVKDCRSTINCQVCSKRHHSLLHTGTQQLSTSPASVKTTSITSASKIDSSIPHCVSPVQQSYPLVNHSTQNIIPTALILVKDIYNNYQTCRVLLDSGSQITLISECCVRRLNLKRTNARITINGVDGEQNKETCTRGSVILNLKSRFNEETFITRGYILNTLTSYLPSAPISSSSIQHYKSFNELADPSFDHPSKIDIIIGVDIFFKSFKQESYSSANSSLSAIRTSFGWIIGGQAPQRQAPLCLHVSQDIDQTLRSFWEIEEPTASIKLQPTDQECEEHYQQTVQRLPCGRYQVRLPFKHNPRLLGHSKQQAITRLFSMERRFDNNHQFASQYRQFMNEYLLLQHMENAPSGSHSSEFFLPHHGIVKAENTSTKLRVVFDGSAQSTTGCSLNDLLHTGPKIQKELYDIILRFRTGKIGFIADVIKMYRQIAVHPEDRPYQKIVWRPSNGENIQEYMLTTVTYGTSCAPFLALRTLQQVYQDEGSSHPLGSQLLQNNVYVDDLMGSADSIKEAIRYKDDLVALLNKAHFELHKWSSNSIDVLRTIPTNRASCEDKLTIDDTLTVKTLGLIWRPSKDVFSFRVHIEHNRVPTKRQVLSIISRIYDPLGLLAPYTVIAKSIMQELWIAGISWDDPLPESLETRWRTVLSQLQQVTLIEIPRWIGTSRSTHLEIHGFCDASERAYAAVIYARVIMDNRVKVQIITAKTKLAPIKQISIPRLELCGAHLLAKLMKRMKQELHLPKINCTGWTDSTVVLSWLRQHPRKWTTFVGNRTSLILETLPFKMWNHVPSSMNPADVASRGFQGSNIADNKLWWNGPDFLEAMTINLPSKPSQLDTTMELKKVAAHVIAHDPEDLLLRYSSYIQLIRIVAYILRFVNNARTKSNRNSSEFLTTKELQSAMSTVIKIAQRSTFPNELSIIEAGNRVSPKSRLSSFDPFLDQQGVLRVGGRLRHAHLTYDQRHPVLLSKESPLSHLIVSYYHLKLLHGGGKLLEGSIKLKFWILRVKDLIRKVVQNCVICIRHRAIGHQQKMGDLPLSRLYIGKPFTHTGVDYAGPFMLRTWKGRGAKQVKAWIALFICMTTKALHLELVDDLSTESFIATFKRFLSRRGTVTVMYSDNATNFHGAVRKLNEVNQYFQEKHQREKIYGFLAENQIQWQFIPPATPHFGGLWEAGIRSVKFHMKRIIGAAHLTYGEFYTLICEIEGNLNSRPLIALTDNPEDLEVLTPSHFLCGGPLQLQVEIPLTEDVKNFKTRWLYVQSLKQQFWKRWKRDYLSTLQQRQKWINPSNNIKINDMVLIMDTHLPAGVWALGRVIKTNPGKDQLVRIATIKTKSGIIQRPIGKLALLLPHSSIERAPGPFKVGGVC